MTNVPRIVISIFGNSGVGKSTLANALVSELGQDLSSRTRADHYLRSRGVAPLAEYLVKSDFFDWELLEEDLSHPIGTEISTPVFDYSHFQRISRHGNKAFRVSRFNFVDALIPYPKSTLFILLELDEALRRERFVQRGTDYVWGRFVIDHWDECRKSYENFPIDLTLNSTAPVAENVREVVRFLKARALL